jgi:hypothetical protein
MKWLDDIVVCPGAQPVDLVFPAIARCENQNGIGMTVDADLLDDIDTRHLREAKVDNRQVDRVFAGEIQALLAVSGLFDVEPLFRQPAGK